MFDDEMDVIIFKPVTANSSLKGKFGVGLVEEVRLVS